MMTAIGAAIRAGQKRAESLMVDSCRITGPSEPVWDDETGTYTPGTPTVVYEGRCRLRNAYPAPQSADAGETVWAVDSMALSLPVDGTAGIGDGHEVEMTGCRNDPGMVGLRLTVQAGHFQTDSTARRLPCQVVSRDV